MFENLIREACGEVGLPFHGHVPPMNRWYHFHEDPGRRGGPYFIRLSPILVSGKEKILFVAGDLRLYPPTQVKKIFDGDQSLSLSRKDFEDKINEYEEELSKKVAVKNETAALEAQRLWDRSKPEGTCIYMRAKNIEELHGAKIGPMGELVIPLRDIDGKLWGVQKISGTGKRDKNFLSGQKKRGTFHIIGDAEAATTLNVVEGFATGVSVFKAAPKEAVIVAIDAGNMRRIARDLKKKFRTKRIRFCADKDEAGIKAAKAAALAIGGEYLEPNFGFEHPDYTDFNDLEQIQREVGGISSVREQFEVAEKKKTSFSKQDWMVEYLEENEITYKYSGKVLTGTKKIGYDQFVAQMILASDREGLKIPDRIMDAFITNWISEKKLEEWKRVVSIIAPYDPEGVDVLKSWMIAVTGKTDPIELSVMLHFIWQAKRKALELQVDHHMMPVFIGKTGGGKSEAIKRLIAPLSPLSYTNKLSVCADPRETRLFEDCLVLNMDEMENAEKTDLQALKRTITADEITHRILGTNRHETVENRATLIGSSNEALDFLIKDPTSIRRFYAIETLTLDKFSKSWDLINSLDYVKLWKSVDAYQVSPLKAELTVIRERQEEMRHKTDVEMFAEELGAEPSFDHFKSNEILIKGYKAYCERHENQYPKSMEGIARELVRLGFKRGRKGGKRGFFMLTASDSAGDGPSS
jgi:phage/plasmid primase-like uncharacterized protein